jgi:ribosomal protein RSM22 (predicted rRNA methylase)
MEPFKDKVPARVSPLILRSIEQVAGKSARSMKDCAPQAVADLSRLFTKGRAALNRRYLDDPDHAAAYLRYFLPVNLPKVQVLLDELPVESLFDRQREHLTVLDLGSGPGTGGLAVLDWLQHCKPELVGHLSVVAADSSSVALQQAERLWTAYCREAGIKGARLTLCEDDLEKLWSGVFGDWMKQGGPYDLIILANCLNELFAEAADPIAARTVLVAELLPLLAPHGTLMIVEPALRETSRGLHQVRDRLLQEKRCTVYSPCLHEGNCPALIYPDDWCHEERAWEAPASIQHIDQEIGFIKDALKFSYLLLRKDGRTIVEQKPNVFRVVSELREMKGEKRAWLCNELGRQEVGRQDRLASPQNEAFDRWHRGAIVQIERVVRKERDGKMSALGRIERDVAVKIVRPV